jgi:Bacterial regulatory proteins, tetR family
MRSALRLFAKRGYDAVGVQEIVVTAKVTKPASALRYVSGWYHEYVHNFGIVSSSLLLFDSLVC